MGKVTSMSHETGRCSNAPEDSSPRAVSGGKTTKDLARILDISNAEKANNGKKITIETGSIDKIPTTFSKNQNNEYIPASIINFNIMLYSFVLKKAETLINKQENIGKVGSTQYIMTYIHAINEAIATELRPGQDDTARTSYLNNKNTVLSAKEIKDKKLEVCVEKATIAHIFLRKHHIPSDLIFEAAYKGGEDGHAYCNIYIDGERKVFHANSPHYNIKSKKREANIEGREKYQGGKKSAA